MDNIEAASAPLPLSKMIIAVATVGLVVALILQFLTPSRDSREPPYLWPKLPLAGHILGLIRQGSDYLHKLELRYHKPIFTLPVFKGRMYIVTTPELAQAVHKAHRSVHFHTLLAQAMKNLFLMDDDAMKILNENRNGEDGTRRGIMNEVHDMMLTTLAPGQFLNDLNKNTLDAVLPHMNNLAKDGPLNTKFWSWLRHHFSLASIRGLWGPRNPFELYPEVELVFWEFEANAMPLTMMPFPQFLARKGYEARKICFERFEEYAANEGYDDEKTSQLIKNRKKMNMDRFGLSRKMYARGETSLLFGALLNTVPLAFWLVSWIFEDRELLKDIRKEVDDCVTTSPSDPQIRVMNATKFRTSCPLFQSTFREALRLTAAINLNRHVSEDTTVTNSSTGETFLLKKDSVIQIASNVIHAKPLWGSDPMAFEPRRFMGSGEKARNASDTDSTKIPDPAAPFRGPDGKVYSSAFRSFGGGNNICPGRHFAQTEILGLASLFVAGFEIQGADGREYKMPPYEAFKLALGTIKPGKDVDVVISRRKGYEDVEWAFEF